MRRNTWLILIAVALVISACIPPEPDDDVIVNYDPEETVMGEIQERNELVVGVPLDSEPFGTFATGFGDLIRDALGVETTGIVHLPPEELLRAPEEGTVDISFPLIAITEKQVRRHTFTDPIYIAHQRLLVHAGSPIAQVTDIEGPVCQFVRREVNEVSPGEFVTMDIGANLNEIDPTVTAFESPDPTSCTKDLLAGKLDAVSASDWLLYPLLKTNPGALKIVGDDLTTEAYGAVVESGASGWSDFVNGVLAEADAEGDWQKIYDDAFGELAEEDVTYPDMTVEEAAALYPREV